VTPSTDTRRRVLKILVVLVTLGLLASFAWRGVPGTGPDPRLTSKDPLQRAAAAREMSGRTDDESLGLLLGLLADAQGEVRGAAAAALQAAGAAGAHALTARLASERRQGVRFRILSAMEDGDPAKGFRVPQSLDPDELARYFLWRAAFGRLSSLDRLVDAAKRAPAVLEAASADPMPQVRQAAFGALGRIGGPKGIETLIRGFSDPDLQVRAQAFLSLRLLKDPSCVPLLLASLAAADPVAKRYALDLLGDFPDAPLPRGVLEAMTDASPAVRAAAGSPLTDIDTK